MNNCAILVLSCDKYSDLWNPFFTLFKRYWNNCPFPVYLGSNTITYSDTSIQTVLSGKGIDWSTDLLRILRQIKQEYLFIWLEDFFPTKQINRECFDRCFDFMKKEKANHIHFSPAITPDGICSDSFFGYYEKGAPYRVIVEGFWKKSHLEKLLIPGENPWNFEIMGSYRSSYSDGYYTTMKPLFEFIRVVEKGKITREAQNYCCKHNITLSLDRRLILTFWEQQVYTIQSHLFHIIRHISWKKRVMIMNILRKLLISY